MNYFLFVNRLLAYLKISFSRNPKLPVQEYFAIRCVRTNTLLEVGKNRQTQREALLEMAHYIWYMYTNDEVFEPEGCSNKDLIWYLRQYGFQLEKSQTPYEK